MSDDEVMQVKVEALREAADDFLAASQAGVEPALNRLAAKLLYKRAARVKADQGVTVQVVVTPVQEIS